LCRLTIADLKNVTQVNRLFNEHVFLMKSDKTLLLQNPYHSDVEQEKIHLVTELIEKASTRKFEKISVIFYSLDYVRFFQNAQENQMLNMFRLQLMNRVQENIMDRQKTELNFTMMKDCYIWKQREHMLEKCILEPKLGIHDKNCRNSGGIHMCKSWKKEKLAFLRFLMNWKKKRKQRKETNSLGLII